MLLDKLIEGISKQDLPLLESLLHKEMLFVQETTLETKEEWMQATKEQFENGILDATKMTVTVKFETKDMGALELTREEENGTLTCISNVLLYKEEKIFRHLINQVSIKQT